MSIDAVIIGAAGYVGGELLRLIAAHPQFELAAALSSRHAGEPIGLVFPHLHQAYRERTFSTPRTWADAARGSDIALFSAAPHGASAPAIKAALALATERNLNVRVVDSSADFRYGCAETFERVYGIPHPAPELLAEFACAVPEHAPETRAPYAGHPGCFTTAALLAALPLIDAGLVRDDIYLSGITGSTGSGRDPRPGTHHPERHSNLYTYLPLRHRHAPEIAALVKDACGVGIRVHFVPHSAPFARGIHMTLQARLQVQADTRDIEELFSNAYARSSFVRFVDGSPRLKDVVGSNQCHIGAAVDATAISVMCVIDNLVKGAAGGALQWMNRLWSLPDNTGLLGAAPAWI